MATSPTPSLDSIRGTNSIESYGEHNGYLSDSPLTLSGSSPPVSDSAICDEFTSTETSSNQHHPISASVSSSSSASSSSSSSGLSGCGSTSSAISRGSSSSGNNGNGSGPGVIGSNLHQIHNNNGTGSLGLLSTNSNTTTNTSINDVGVTGNVVPRCTACKSKQSSAVARCFECISFLCANCATAHEFMHCFNGHNVFQIKGFEGISTANTPNGTQTYSTTTVTNNPASADFKFSSSLTMMLQQQQQNNHLQKQHHVSQNHQQLSQLSKIVLNSHAAQVAASTANSVFSDANDQHFDLGNTNTDELSNMFSNMRSSSGCGSSSSSPSSSLLFCHRHKHELLKYNCRTCCTLICKDCVVIDHSSGIHEIELVQEHAIPSSLSAVSVPPFNPQAANDVVQTAITDVRGKVGEMVTLVNNADTTVAKIKLQYQKAHNDINETHQFFCSMLDERKHELLKELDGLYNAKTTTNNTWLQRAKDLIEKAAQTCDAIERSPKSHNTADVLILRKTLDLQLQASLQNLQFPFEMEFISNYQSIQAGIRNTFGYIRPTNSDSVIGSGKQPPIARPTQHILSGSSTNGRESTLALVSHHLPSGLGISSNLLDNGSNNSFMNGGNSFIGRHSANIDLRHHNNGSSFEDLLPKRFGGVSALNPYEKWSNGGADNLFSNNTATSDPFASSHLLNSLANGTVVSAANTLTALNMAVGSNANDSLLDLTSKILSVPNYPPKSQTKRQKMIYHCKFGEFGVLEGQFTEPSGVAVNAQNDIIVADTNNHRIQIFDKEGRFKFQFGECGKRDSQLLYPNRVAVVKSSGDIIVTERSPTHQIQIYNQYGQFVRKFGANILQHPRGVTVDNQGRIIVVECKVMRVIIFDQSGNVLHKFGCSKHLEFPNGVVVNDKQEIFISDNRAHCVKVFNYEGQYLRQIGGEGVTNYPIGVGINSNGEILIADNHNNFNLTIFTQEGQLVSALESKVKHAQCFDVSLMDDGSVVLASKDYRLYIYRYVQVPPIAM